MQGKQSLTNGKCAVRDFCLLCVAALGAIARRATQKSAAAAIAIPTPRALP